MKLLVKIISHLFLPCLLLTSLIIFLITPYGAKLIIYLGQGYIPGSLTIQTITGSIVERNLSLKNITYVINTFKINIQQLNLSWDYQYTDHWQINCQVTGMVNNYPLNGMFSLNLNYQNYAASLTNTRIILGTNQAIVTEENADNLHFFFNLANLEQIIPTITGNLGIKGVVTNYTSQPKLALNAVSNGISTEQLKLNTAKLSLNLDLYANYSYTLDLNLTKIIYQDTLYKLLTFTSHGDALNNTSLFQLDHPDFEFSTQIQANLDNKYWLNYPLINNPVTGSIYFNNVMLKIKLEDGATITKFGNSTIDLAMQYKQLTSNIMLRLDNSNYVSAILKLDDQQFQAQFLYSFTNLTILENIFPYDLNNVAGSLTSSTHISGTLANLHDIGSLNIDTKTKLQDFKVDLFNLGLQINNVNLSIRNHNNSHELVILGSGKTISGTSETLLLKGSVDYTNLQSLKLSLTGNNIKLLNNDEYNISLSPNLTASINKKNKIRLLGDLIVNHGKINIPAEDKDELAISSDVVFIEKHPEIAATEKLNKSSAYALSPSIHIRMKHDVYFSGFGINTILTGDINITKKHHNYLGDGRITIKKGSYKLPGKTLTIKRGRLLYAPGTLLSNPALDIKLSNKKEDTGNFDLDTEQILYVQGTLHAPIIVNSGLLTSASATSQIFNSGSSVFTEKLQEKLGLEELGLANSPSSSSGNTDDSILENKQFVIGKKISNRLYLQYLKDLTDTNNTIRLKFKLLKNLSIGIESGTFGSGSDLYYSKETD